jgi:DNA-directed RNA polymerase subunit alpha
MLLSSIEGAAIVSTRFEGVYHEFSAIPGVLEDVTEIILNLKEVHLKMADEISEKRIYLKKDKTGKVYAKDIADNPQITVLNPDHHIATLDASGELNMEMIVRKGRGYVPAENQNMEGEPVQMIPIDAIFSPIEKVRYHIEHTRVGQSTDYDSLVMELWTNGGIIPDDAVAHAAKILKDHMQVFINFDEEPEPAQTQVDEKRQALVSSLTRSVEELELSVRSYNCLKNANIQSIAELVQKTDSEMLKTRNFGRKSLNEIKAILEGMGLHLGMKLEEDDLKQIAQVGRKPEAGTDIEL